MATPAPRALVAAAQRQPLPYGLFSTFTWRTGSDRWESGVQFETDTCDPAQAIGEWNCERNEVKVVTLGGEGLTSFTLTYYGWPTAALDPGATAAEVRAALEALPNIGAGNIAVTGTPGGPYTLTFIGDLATEDVPVMTATPTGGTGTVTVTDLSQGREIVGLPKGLDSNLPDLGEASPFTVYGHFRCSPVGWSVQAAQERALRHLLTREEARAEQAFWTGNLGNTPNLVGSVPTVLTADTFATALGALEEHIALEYGSLGVIHMTRTAALIAIGLGLAVTSGGRINTVLGTPVAAGAGYPGTGPTGDPNADPDDGFAWMWVTPPLFGYRSEVFDSSNRPGDLLDRAQNTLYAVAERTYLLGYDDCPVGAVYVDLLTPGPFPA